MKVNFVSKGKNAQSPNTLIQNIARQKEAQAQKALERAAAFSRGVMRRSMRKGRTKWGKKKNYKTGKISRGSIKRQRTASRPGKPPNYHVNGNGFSFKWIRFTRINNYSYKIGPEYKRTKGAWRSRFRIDRMMERGGSGKVLAPMELPDTKEGWRLFARVRKHGMKWPETFVTARYKARPFASPAAEPTLKQFPTLYKQ